MQTDALGLIVTTRAPAAVAAYDTALMAYLEYRLAAQAHVKAALGADPQFLMGLCFRGYMLMQLGTVEIADKVAGVVAAAKALAGDATAREAGHVAALEHWAAGRVGDACRLWEEILIEAPGDLLALRLHHFMSFWQGRRAALRDLPAAAAGRLDPAMPGYGFVLGMLAFGLEECGDYAEAERYGRHAVELNREDLWAVHAVAHVLEMQCRHEEGTQWLDQPFGTWDDRNPFKDHLWWHAALFSLELGDFDRVLDIYDREVRVDETGFYLDVQNAASMLMRLELLGVDIGGRWEALADIAEQRKDDHVLPFTDAHFMLAFTGAGRIASARTYLDSLKRFAAAGGADAAGVTASLTVPLAEGLLAYGEGACGKAVDRLLPMRHEMAPLGGSHAQQDVFQQILIDAAIRDGRTELARSLLAERAVLRPRSRWAHDRLAALA
ncbi:MAG: tetratricopeptide repeat protein [Alphaproteobacteria bacterium]|nr:tetratricopeptide repeat protein [Alphaproteobacteria bacterium]